jgi:hypothetical protein
LNQLFKASSLGKQGNILAKNPSTTQATAIKGSNTGLNCSMDTSIPIPARTSPGSKSQETESTTKNPFLGIPQINLQTSSKQTRKQNRNAKANNLKSIQRNDKENRRIYTENAARIKEFLNRFPKPLLQTPIVVKPIENVPNSISKYYYPCNITQQLVPDLEANSMEEDLEVQQLRPTVQHSKLFLIGEIHTVTGSASLFFYNQDFYLLNMDRIVETFGDGDVTAPEHPILAELFQNAPNTFCCPHGEIAMTRISI